MQTLTMAGRLNNFGLFSETDSDEETFEGFNVHDTRRYSQLASEANLFTSTPVPKRKRTANDTSSSDISFGDSDKPSLSPVQLVPKKEDYDSSSASLEGEVAERTFSYSFSRSSTSFPEVVNADNTEEESPSSVEGEIKSEHLSDTALQKSRNQILPVSVSFARDGSKGPSEANTENIRRRGG